jgi:hypothetical protein
MTDILPLLQAKRERIGQLAAAAGLDHGRGDLTKQLAIELPKAIEGGLQEAAASGELVVRFNTAMEICARRGLEGDEQLRAALFAVLQEQGVRAGRWLRHRGEAFEADACRAEGAAAELLGLVSELEQLLPPAADPRPAANAAPVAAPPAAEGQEEATGSKAPRKAPRARRRAPR